MAATKKYLIPDTSSEYMSDRTSSPPVYFISVFIIAQNRVISVSCLSTMMDSVPPKYKGPRFRGPWCSFESISKEAGI